MPNKPTPPAKLDDPEQSNRFIDMAREVAVDERPEAVDEVFKKVIGVPNAKAETPDPEKT